jgi:nitrogen regulatory protein P-II 1
VTGMTISQVQGCGNQHGWKEYYRGTEVMLNMLPKVKFEVVVDDAQVDQLVSLIVSTAKTGEVGDGKIFVFPCEQVVRIRTGESGPSAV